MQYGGMLPLWDDAPHHRQSVQLAVVARLIKK